MDTSMKFIYFFTACRLMKTIYLYYKPYRMESQRGNCKFTGNRPNGKNVSRETAGIRQCFT